MYRKKLSNESFVSSAVKRFVRCQVQIYCVFIRLYKHIKVNSLYELFKNKKMLEFDNLWYFARTKLIDNLFRIHQSQKRSGKNQSKHFFFILSALSPVNILQTYRDNSDSREIRQRITQRSSIFIEWIEWITMFQSRGKYLQLLVSIYPTHFQLPTDHPFGEKHSRECHPFPFLPSHPDTTSASSSLICGFGSTSGKTPPCCLYRHCVTEKENRNILGLRPASEKLIRFLFNISRNINKK